METITEFFGLEFIDTADTLTPYAATEFLTQYALDLIRLFEAPEICDVGTGTGCIALSLLCYEPKARAIGLDISAAALEVAGRNARLHGISSRLELRESDCFSALSDELFDLIVCNPPYCSAEIWAGLSAEYKSAQPREAFTDGGSGLSLITRLAESAEYYLRPGGFLLIEYTAYQTAAILKMFDLTRWESAAVISTPGDQPRAVLAVKPKA